MTCLDIALEAGEPVLLLFSGGSDVAVAYPDWICSICCCHAIMFTLQGIIACVGPIKKYTVLAAGVAWHSCMWCCYCMCLYGDCAAHIGRRHVVKCGYVCNLYAAKMYQCTMVCCPSDLQLASISAVACKRGEVFEESHCVIIRPHDKFLRAYCDEHT